MNEHVVSVALHRTMCLEIVGGKESIEIASFWSGLGLPDSVRDFTGVRRIDVSVRGMGGIENDF